MKRKGAPGFRYSHSGTTIVTIDREPFIPHRIKCVSSDSLRDNPAEHRADPCIIFNRRATDYDESASVS